MMLKTKGLHLFFCVQRSIDDVGVSRDTVFQELRSGGDFKTGDFVKRKLGGATVERLKY